MNRPTCGMAWLLVLGGVAGTAGFAGERGDTAFVRGAPCGESETLTAAADAHGAFVRLVDAYFDAFFRHYPTKATAAGLHAHDHLLEDHTPAALDARVTAFTKFVAALKRVDPRHLGSLEAGDRELLLGHARAQLLDLQQIRMWEKNPDLYASEVNYSIFLLVGRDFAPAAERLKAVIARESQIPKTLVVARANLKNPPRVRTEIALEKLPGIIAYFDRDVPAAFLDVKDEKLQAKFRSANQGVVDALRDYQQFLQKELLPRSNGDYRLGADTLRRKLLYEDMIDIPLERLRQLGRENLRANQAQFRQTAARIDSQRTPLEVLAAVTADHPAPNDLLPGVRNCLGDLRTFIVQHKLLTLPTSEPPIVAETPPYKRALSWASVDTPGPYETAATKSYYFVTPPEKTWPAQRIREHMEAFSYPELANLCVHEAYPGHYTHYLSALRAPTKTRRILYCKTNTEGWAHYAEQMMLDEGYGNDDPKLRLAQLHDALLRNVRFLVNIEMHAGTMTRDEAVEFFMRDAYQTRAAATVEANRGTSDSMYLVYTLGKLAVLKFRADYEQYQKARGATFTLRQFHDGFLRQGLVPIKLIRREMIGDNGPAL